MKFYQTREFIRLQSKWQKRLRESGFNDIEPVENAPMPERINVRREQKRPERLLSIQEYFCQASRFYWDYNFKSEREKRIWFYYSEGLTMREIALLMRFKSHTPVYTFLKQIEPVFLQYVRAQWEFENEDDEREG